MVTLKTGVILTLLLTSTAGRGRPTWKNIGPGGGGWLPTVAVSPVDSHVVFAGCDVGGFYRSLDDGATWQICNAGLRDYCIEVIAPHPTDPAIVYVGTESGVHRSVDGGRTWTLLREGFPPTERYRYSAPIGALAIDPRHPEVLYAGIGRPREGDSGQGAIYRTVDSGAHWKLANPGGGGMDPSAIVNDLAVQPGRSDRIYAATDRGLYVSESSGAKWRLLKNGLPETPKRRIAICRTHPNTLYVSVTSPPGEQTRQGGVFRSDDGGETWTDRSKGLATEVGKPGAPAPMTSNVDRLVVDPNNPEVVYAGDWSWVSAGVYRSRDGGASWKRLTQPNDKAVDYGWITMWGPSVTGLTLDPQRPGTLYFGTSGHLFRSTDSGDRWQEVYTRRASKPAGAPERPGGWWSGTGMETTCLNSVAVSPRDPNRLYFCYFDIGLLQSFDGGHSFSQTVDGMANQGNTFAVAFDPDNPRTLWAGTGEWGSNHGDVCRSDDGGITWRVVGKPASGLPDGQTHHLIVDPGSPASARRILVSVEGSGVFGSEDGGVTWAARNSGLGNAKVRGLARAPGNPIRFFALLDGTSESGGGVYSSSDRGKTWQRTSAACPWASADALAVCPKDPKRIYVGAREEYTGGKMVPGGVFVSRDGGVTWSRVLADSFIASLAVDPNDANTVVAGGTDNPYHDGAVGSGVRISRDGGVTWESMNTPELTCRDISCLTIDPHHPDRLYAGTAGNGVFVFNK